MRVSSFLSLFIVGVSKAAVLFECEGFNDAACSVKNVILTHEDPEIRVINSAYWNKAELLKISESKIEFLPVELFHRFPSLKYLTITKSKICDGKIHDNFFKDMAPIEELNLGFNNLTEISGHAFSKLTRLKVLNLQYNNLTISKMPSNLISHNSKLEYLDCTGNPSSFLYTLEDEDHFCN